ncbi:MAG: HAD family phosphatase [Spirochaetales bacterium]|jgi:putative hydrolase of the HAD superfamily
MSIKTIIFDCGRVITQDQNPEIAGKMAAIIGAGPGEFAHAYAAGRAEYDRGTMSAVDYWNRVAGRFGRQIGPDHHALLVQLDMDSWFTINGETIALIRALKTRGYRLLILSNMNVEGKERMYGQARILDGEDWVALFDDVLLSCDLRQLKPKPEIYRSCLERAAAQPGECLFIDDIPANVEAARASGMHSIHFTGAKELAFILAEKYKAL